LYFKALSILLNPAAFIHLLNSRNQNRKTMRTKNIVALAITTGILLLVPFVAMQFTDEVSWTASDFVIAAVILFGTGVAFLALKGRSRSIYYRLAAGLAVIASFLLLWSNLAVGFIGSGPNPANLMYGGMLAIGIFGSIWARFRPAGMAHTMFALAMAQVLVPLIALSLSDISVSPEEGRAVAGITGIFVVLWIGAGLLFRRAELTTSEGAKA
jgi:hypothetical protein